MKISLTVFNYNQNNNVSGKYSLPFGHHPDFNEIMKKRPICYSDYFRRENTSSGPQSFLDLVGLFRKVFTGNNEPKKMLIVGIANSEEPFSYLTTIKQINNNKPIENILDLHIIDLQSKPDKDKLFKDSFALDYLPFYAKDSFVFDPSSPIALCNYRVNDELFEFLCKTYENPSKSRWESRVQEAVYPKNYFDIISVNNVLYYIPEPLVIPTFDNLCNAVKPGGYIIAEDDRYAENSKNKDHLVRYAGAIYKKV